MVTSTATSDCAKLPLSSGRPDATISQQCGRVLYLGVATIEGGALPPVIQGFGVLLGQDMLIVPVTVGPLQRVQELVAICLDAIGDRRVLAGVHPGLVALLVPLVGHILLVDSREAIAAQVQLVQEVVAVGLDLTFPGGVGLSRALKMDKVLVSKYTGHGFSASGSLLKMMNCVGGWCSSNFSQRVGGSVSTSP